MVVVIEGGKDHTSAQKQLEVRIMKLPANLARLSHQQGLRNYNRGTAGSPLGGAPLSVTTALWIQEGPLHFRPITPPSEVWAQESGF